jgi:hypothetical protein
MIVDDIGKVPSLHPEFALAIDLIKTQESSAQEEFGYGDGMLGDVFEGGHRRGADKHGAMDRSTVLGVASD